MKPVNLHELLREEYMKGFLEGQRYARQTAEWLIDRKTAWGYTFYCSSCGTIHDETTTYCPDCGKIMLTKENNND